MCSTNLKNAKDGAMFGLNFSVAFLLLLGYELFISSEKTEVSAGLVGLVYVAIVLSVAVLSFTFVYCFSNPGERQIEKITFLVSLVCFYLTIEVMGLIIIGIIGKYYLS